MCLNPNIKIDICTKPCVYVFLINSQTDPTQLVSFICRNGNIALENRNRKTEAKQDFCHWNSPIMCFQEQEQGGKKKKEKKNWDTLTMGHYLRLEFFKAHQSYINFILRMHAITGF